MTEHTLHRELTEAQAVDALTDAFARVIQRPRRSGYQITINGVSCSVEFDYADDEWLTARIKNGDTLAMCPACIADTDFTYESDGRTQRIVCQSCGSAWPLVVVEL